MTTPQKSLHMILNGVERLAELLEGNEYTGDITETLAHMELQNDDLINSMQRIENLLNLIVKLLGEYGQRPGRDN